MRSAAAYAVVLALTVALAQGADTQIQGGGKWLDTFEAHRESIRPLDPTARKACESQLHQILKDLDDHAACAVDSECTLVDQQPFGRTVPIRADSATAVLSAMKGFARSCDSHLSHSVQNNEMVSSPACVKNRCLVRVSWKAGSAPCDATTSTPQLACNQRRPTLSP
jgi:hypothetical protein